MKQPRNEPIKLPGGDEGYILVEEYRYQWTMPDKMRREIVIPKGFIYDGASVPRIVWTLSGITPDGLIRAAALVHDFIYRYAGRLPRGAYGMLKEGVWVDLTLHYWTRESADKIFARIMREAGVPVLKRRAAYIGVRAGGWASWKGEKKPAAKMILNR